ncbi:ESPR-type extended signal peptide-containing protein [Acidaminococcus fermentans]|uniref:ESPR-type extended signal peptide-containing protein n=1 Tax=Acidaminococcus fermentans TaxID=905 RepID=UPI002E7A9E4C|nr:ESPR-type extended signal peptide-containing protein [Acidaminococcus fermentans]MEE1597520.1 ESPR-type extended signal peptide-containing protein [Acidaminococcus fermentans]MEE4121783.1 ESPR-type extended signal peptide-containing protein [Acidaminococcus fermentans]
MNRIYKVIWNKTRGMYMVVSELAKGQSKDGRRAVGRKKVAQTAAALAVFFSIVSMGGTTFAADTTKVESSTSDTAVEVYTKDGTDAQIEAARKYTYRKTAELDQKLTDQKTSTALHISSTGDLIVGIKENQTVKDMEIRGKLTSGSLSTGDITSTGDVTVTGKVAADGVTDETTKDGTYIKQNNTVGNNLVSLDKQVKANDDRITAVKKHLQKEAADTYVSKNDAAVQDGAIVKAANTIGDNVTKLDAALAKETAARLGADAAQDKVIQQVNDNLVTSVNTINESVKTTNENMAAGFTALSQADANEVATREAKDNELNERITNEANAIHETTKQLQTDLNTEMTARETADAALDTRITNVKEYLEKRTSDNYVSKADAAVQDGAVVKAANTIGENVANLDAALDAEKNARIWADKTQDKVIQQVNQNMVDGFNTINKNMADGFTALNQADAKEAQERAAADAALDDKITAETSARVAADTKLVEAVNSGLSLRNDNVLQKNITTIDAQGNVTTSKTDANEMILNKGKDNQITLNEKGIKVGTNSTVVDKDGVYTGGDTYSEAKAAMSADGKIKGANGDFTVDENGNVTSKATITGETVTDGKGASMSNGTVTGKTLTDGIATITNGNINTSGSITGGTVTSTGNISALGDIHAGGAITGASASIQGALTAGSATITGGLTAGGAIQGKSISDGTATMQNGNLTGVKNLSAETITTSGDATIGGDLTVKGKLNVDEIDLTKNGIVGDNNVTASTKVAAGEITSYKKATSTKDGSEKESAIDYDENGTSTWAKSTDADGNWKKSTLTVEGSDVTSKVVDSDKNSNESKQTSQESSDVVKDADGNTSTFSQRVKDILQEIKNAAGDTLTKVEQTDTAITSQIGDGSAVKSEMTADGITNTAEGGTITNSAKDLVNTATGNMTNTVGGKMLNDVTGDMENKVGGNQTTTVTGDSILTAENITNEARNKITNKALDVETDASSSIVSKVSNEYGSNTSTQLSYQTTEEMSQADGKKASYLRGAAEEKSQLTDGDKKTTIDTIAGQTNTNITDGTNTSNSLQKADQVASSVTDGTNTTVVNQDATSLASSITDGTKANNTNSTVDKSEQLIKASDTQYSATTKTASKTEDALVSGSSVIDVIKSLDDAANPLISSAVTDGTNTTGVTQTAKDITNTAKNGTIANDAKNITNTAAENMTNTVGKDLTTTVDGEMKTTVTGKTMENYNGGLETTITGEEKHTVNGSQINAVTGDQTNTIGGSQTTTVTGDSSLSAQNITNTASETLSNSAKNITNTAAEKLSNSAAEIENTATKSIKDKVGENVSRTMTTSKIAESVVDGTKSNSSSKTADKDINIVTDGTSTSTLSQLAGSVNTSLKEVDSSGNSVKSLNNVQTVSEDTTKITDTASGDFSSRSQKANGFTSLVKNNSGGSNTVTDTATKSEQKLVSGNIIDILKDAENGYVNTTVSNSDGSSSTGVKQTYTDITSTAEQGTITHEAKDLVNEAAENITNTAGNRIQDKVGTTTVTTTDGLTKLTNEAGNHKTQMDYAEVLQDLSVGGNATVTGDVTAKSYKVGDKTYINENGINANGQKITNVADGTIAEDSTDAVNGGQLNATNQRVTTVENRMDGVENRMDRVENRVDNLDNRIDKVGASAAAMANLHPMDFDEDSKVSVAAAMGSYRSETAGALGVFYRPTDRVMLNVSTSFGNGENMIGGGVSFKLGKSSKRLEKAEATNAALAKQVTNLQNRLDALLGVLNPSLSKDFPDVPANHWAYEAVSRLAGNDIIQGYEDGKYHGERTMTRYEMAEIIYNALSKGAKAEAKLVEEFRPELQAMAAQRKA